MKDMIIYDNELESIYKLLKSMNLNYNDTNYSIYNISDIINSSKQFYGEYFNLHSVYFNNSLKINADDNYYKKMLMHSKKIIPFNIPINQEGNDISCVSLYPFSESSNIIFVNKINMPIYDRDGLLVPSYSHEIAHTQYVYNDSIYKGLNDEVIPIFIEMLCSNYYGLLNKDMDFRLSYLKKILKVFRVEGKSNISLSKNYRDDVISYIYSTLKANMLFSIYLDGSKNLQTDIINDIQYIFDGIMGLDGVLNKYDISNDTCKRLEFIKK